MLALQSKTLKIYLSTILLGLSSCSMPSETVESGRLPLRPIEPKYSFSRNGQSSVDTRELDQIKAPISRLYKHYLRPGGLTDTYEVNNASRLWEKGDGISGFAPKDLLLKSGVIQGKDRDLAIERINSRIKAVSHVSGLKEGGTSTPLIRHRAAQRGQTGYIGSGPAKDTNYYADEKGLVPSEVFMSEVRAFFYLDQLLEVNLSGEIFGNEELRKAHILRTLVRGYNYTTFEHHWDLAYACFKELKPTIFGSQPYALQKIHNTVFEAFVLGREAIGLADW